jgi:SAM-dependent methyltransferase
MNAWHEQDAFWEKWAPIMFHERRWEKTAEEVANIISLLNIGEATSVLDLCCGPGRHSLELARQGFSVTAVDMGKEVLARIFRERDWYELDNTMILAERKVCANWTWMENRWLMVRDGKMDECKVSHRLYSAAELAALLSDCGFKVIDVYGDLTGAPYDHTAKRLVLVAHKGNGET